jgi:hypothetical protein
LRLCSLQDAKQFYVCFRFPVLGGEDLQRHLIIITSDTSFKVIVLLYILCSSKVAKIASRSITN